MLETFVATDQSYDSYLRPAIHDSIRAVLKFYGVDSATNIYYNGNNDITSLIGNNSTDSPTADRHTDGIFRNKIFIVPDVQRSEFWQNRRAMTERPVFIAKEKLPLIVCPSFENKIIKVRVVTMHNSSSDAERFQKMINRKRENQVVDFSFNPITHMVFNEPLLEFIEVVHGLLKKNKPDTPEFVEWFYQQTKFPFEVISNAAGNNKQMVVMLKSMNVGIQLSDAFISKAAKGSTYGRFEVEFEYSFYLNDFIGWELEYPLNVYQDEIPHAYISPQQPANVDPVNVKASPEIEDGRAITDPNPGIQEPYYLKLPDYDPWAHPKQFWIQPIIQARLALADVEEQALGNMFDLPGFDWVKESKEYILRRHGVAFSHFETPFLMQLFEGDQLVDPAFVRMDANGLITLYRRPNMAKTYRLVLTLDYAIRDYSESFWDDLRKNPKDWFIITNTFFWFDFNQIPKPWSSNVFMITDLIDKGWGKPSKPFNIYEMNLGFIAHNLGK